MKNDTRRGAAAALESETERCPRCLQLHAYEATVWCARCDGPVCPFCVVRTRESRELTCADCAPGASGRSR